MAWKLRLLSAGSHRLTGELLAWKLLTRELRLSVGLDVARKLNPARQTAGDAETLLALSHNSHVIRKLRNVVLWRRAGEVLRAGQGHVARTRQHCGIHLLLLRLILSG